jgi:paraquat-inducible protein B
MSRRASPALIGAFVLAGLALLVVGVLIFGGREIFREKRQFVTYFDGSVQGLRVGSNVLFRGVRVGYVTDIAVVTDASLADYEIPVTFEILPAAVSVVADGKEVGSLADAKGSLDSLIAAGLRTRLDVESFVTGQLVVNLDMFPGTEPRFRGRNPPHPEIPSVPSQFREAVQRIQAFLTDVESKVPVERVAGALLSAIDGFDKLVNSPDLAATLAGVSRVVNNPSTQALPATLEATTAELGAAARDVRALATRLDATAAPALEQLVPVMTRLEATLGEAEQVLTLARGQLAQNPEAAAQLADALRELERSARAIRVLVESLERQPESLLRGKQAP